MNTPIIIVAAISIVLVIFIQVAVMASRYVRVGPNQALIISGRKIRLPDGRWAGFRVVKGGGTFVWPVLEKVDVLSLEVLTLEMPKTKVRTTKGGPVEVDCLAQVKIQSDDASIACAAEHFLTRTPEEIKNNVRPVLEKHLCAALDGLSLEAANQNSNQSANKVQAIASDDLGKMGLGILSFTIRDVRAV